MSSIQKGKKKGHKAKFFTLGQLAKLLGLSQTTIYRMVKDGTLPHQMSEVAARSAKKTSGDSTTPSALEPPLP
jgi:predicted DNA-binding transcriptional regulator AlpA